MMCTKRCWLRRGLQSSQEPGRMLLKAADDFSASMPPWEKTTGRKLGTVTASDPSIPQNLHVKFLGVVSEAVEPKPSGKVLSRLRRAQRARSFQICCATFIPVPNAALDGHKSNPGVAKPENLNGSINRRTILHRTADGHSCP